ncbi:hypothetical protein [Pseudomonas sp. McL0111]|uniref:hypothetical protein n=1 Tax=Pseudomonas sp. McL0111 TaxID=3457357 RepID=UPI00403E6F33
MKAREFSQYQNNDVSGKGQSTQTMNTISREEFNARIETIETRMDVRVEVMSADIHGYLAVQAQRDKARELIQAERDKRYDLITLEIRKAANGAEEAAKQASTMKASFWAATAVNLIGIVSIVIGACYANQANMYVAIQTTLAAIQAGKEVKIPKPGTLELFVPQQ